MKKMLLTLVVLLGSASLTEAKRYNKADNSSCTSCNACDEKLCDVVVEKKIVYDKCPRQVCECKTVYDEVPRTLTRKVCTGRAGEWRGAEPCNGNPNCGRCKTCHEKGHVLAEDKAVGVDESQPKTIDKKAAKEAKRAATKKAAVAA